MSMDYNALLEDTIWHYLLRLHTMPDVVEDEV